MPGRCPVIPLAVTCRSPLHPVRDGFSREIRRLGGNVNAGTGARHTEFRLDVPARSFRTAFDGLIAHIFHPIHDAGDIATERGVVRSERELSTAYYPSTNALMQFLKTRWIAASQFPIEQTFGSDADLASITPGVLRAFQEAAYLQRGL
ncbi:MAG: insulinase family protein [Candidatus Riflebacteria bacterium]|nr:insulinase family protein [Candidatus Riflebacteria bacterium]